MTQLPKLRFKSLFAYIGDLFLVAEGSVEWVKTPKVRFSMHLLFWSSVLYVIMNGIFGLYVIEYFTGSHSAAIIYRSIHLLFWTYFLIVSIVLASYFYSHLLLTGKDLRIGSIAFFFFLAVIGFSRIYAYLYWINPLLYVYPDALLIPTPYLSPQPALGGALMLYDFVLYSCTTMLSIPYPRIQSDSAIVTAVNVAQVICSVAFLSLIVAMFVQKTNFRDNNAI